MFQHLDAMPVQAGRGPAPRETSVVVIPVACAVAGAVVGLTASVALLLPGALESGGGGLDTTGIGPFLLGLAIMCSLASLMGGCGGAVLGLACSPLALLLGDREDVVPMIVITGAACVPVAIVCGLAELPGPIVLGVGTSAVAIFLVQVPRLIAPVRVLLFLTAMLAGPALVGPRIVRRHVLPDTVGALIVELRTDDSSLQHRVRTKLERVGGTAGLLRALEDRDPRARRAAAIALQYHASEDVRAALELACEDADDHVVMSAEHSLAVVAERLEHVENR